MPKWRKLNGGEGVLRQQGCKQVRDNDPFNNFSVVDVVLRL
jgi:hypothetical protein